MSRAGWGFSIFWFNDEDLSSGMPSEVLSTNSSRWNVVVGVRGGSSWAGLQEETGEGQGGRACERPG